MSMRLAIGTGQTYSTRLLNFWGGLNNSVSDELIAENEVSACSNYIPNLAATGMLKIREGTTQYSAQLTEAATSIYDGKNADYVTTSTKICTLLGVEVDTGLTSSEDPDWATFLGYDIYCNGAEVRKTSDGSTFADLGGTPPAFKYLCVYNNFLFGAGHDLGKLRFADLGTMETWTATNEAKLTNDESNPITGLTKYRESLVVFCNKSFYHVKMFTGITDFQIVYSSHEEGCTSHRSIVVTPYGLFWWSKAGLVWSPDGFNLTYPSQDKIHQTLDSYNRGMFDKVHGLWNPDTKRCEFWLASGSDTTFSAKLYFYPRLGNDGAFFTGEGAGVQMGASGIVIASGQTKVYVGSTAASGYVYEQTGDSDDGTAITAYAETQREVTEYGPTATKRSKKLTPMWMVTPTTSTATYGIYLNNAQSLTESWDITLTGGTGAFVLDESLLDTGTLGSSLEPVDKTIAYSLRWQKIKHRFYHSSAVGGQLRGVMNEGSLIHA